MSAETAKSHDVTHASSEYQQGRWRRIWKRVAFLGFGVAVGAAVVAATLPLVAGVAALEAAGAIGLWGTLGGVGVGALGLVGQGLSRE